MNKTFITALLILFIFTGRGSADESSPLPSYMTRQKLTGFVTWLAARQEYYRAIHELRRLHAWYPSAFSPQAFTVTEQYLLLKGRRYGDILQVNSHYGGGITAPSYLFHIDSYLLAGKYDKAAAGIGAWKEDGSNELNSYIEKRKVFLSVMNAAHGRENKFFAYRKKGMLESYPRIKTRVPVLLNTMKSPFLGAALGVVPGMGYVYGGEVKTGIVSFIAISLTASLSYLGFRYKTPSAGILFGAVATFFYTGSIAGGYRLVKLHNRGVQGRISSIAARELRLAEDQERIFKRYGIGGI